MPKLLRAPVISVFTLLACVIAPPAQAQTAHRANESGADWPYYGHDSGGTRFSPLKQINRENVDTLKVAWTFHVGDISDGSGDTKRSGLETTPILVDGTLYLTTAFNRVIALDPETGKQRWAYDPMIDIAQSYGDGMINRGVATWLDPVRGKGKPCRRTIFEATLDARLIALDAATGNPCLAFGNRGQISLRDVARYIPGEYHMTSPPAVIDDIVVVGSAIDDNARVDMSSGVVRAFDARTGKLRWEWEPLPPNVESDKSAPPPNTATWRTGAGNAWSAMVVDPQRDLVFIPTGSASPDYYGGMRPGDDKWANSIVALHAKTGEMAWGFQLVHHDLWDYDSASPPLLATIKHDGKRCAGGNSRQQNRLPLRSKSRYRRANIPGRRASGSANRRPRRSDVAHAAFSTAPPAVSPQKVTADDAWGITSADRDYCRERIKSLRNDGLFTPPSVNGSLSIPGNVGGMNWSGYAYDPQLGLLLVNSNNVASEMGVIAADKYWDAVDKKTSDLEYTQQRGAPYGMFRTFLFAKAHHLPCVPPPWGTLTAVDLNKGTIKWQVPLGSLAPNMPVVPAGAPSLGGPIVTGGGLVFIAGTLIDPTIRAFDVETGKEIWKSELPTSGGATPMTYQLGQNGKQYLVIAAGGHAKVTQERQSDAIVAYTLP